MKKFLFKNTFNRFDATCIMTALWVYHNGFFVLALMIVVVGGAISAAVESTL